MKKSKKKIEASPKSEATPVNEVPLRPRFRLPYFIIFSIACIIYGNTLWNEYASDDAIVLTENIYVQKGLKGIKDIFTHDVFEGFFKEKKSLVAGGRYRPLSVATFAIEYECYGLQPMYSHAINVLLFAITCVLIYYLLQRLIPHPKNTPFYVKISLLAALLYAAHPIHTEAVANIKGRDEIMSMLFAIAALTSTVLYLKHGTIWLLGAAFAMLLSLLSKENSITFLAIVPLTFYFFTTAKPKQYLAAMVSVFVPTVFYLLLRNQFASSGLTQESSEILNNPFVGANFSQRYATPVYSFLLYYYKLVFPHPLSHDYYFNQIPLIEWGDVKCIAAAIITLSLLGIALSQFKEKSLVSYSILYYFITFSVVSNIFFSVGIIMNERFLFMPSLGYCLLLATGFHYLYKTKRLPAAATLFLASTVLFLYSLKTIARNRVWKNNLTLFLTDVKHSPNSAKVNTSAGGDLLAASDNEPDSLQRKKMIEEAIGYLSKALSIYPENYNALLLMGNAQYKYYKTVDAALPYYNKILQLKKGGELLANQNAGNLLFAEKKYAQAVPYLRNVVNMQPENIEVIVRLSDSYALIGKVDSALLIANYAYQKQPQNAVAVHHLGKIYGRYLNQLDNAIPLLFKATQLQPNDPTYLEDLGVAHGLKGNYDTVIQVMNQLLQIKPNYKQAFINLSISYRNKGDLVQAEYYMKKATEIP